MPMVPREWVVWTCTECDAIVNVCPPQVIENGPYKGPNWCPCCGASLENVEQKTERRAAIDIPGVGLIGSTETAGLDYLASIANSLVDIRNKLFAVYHVPDPIDVPGPIPESRNPTQLELDELQKRLERGG